MMRLVRFERSHADDDEIVATNYGPYPGAEAYLLQLIAELDDGQFKDAYGITLAHAELGPVLSQIDRDAYLLYCHVPTVENETSVHLAERLQEAYDEGGASGFFQVID